MTWPGSAGRWASAARRSSPTSRGAMTARDSPPPRRASTSWSTTPASPSSKRSRRRGRRGGGRAVPPHRAVERRRVHEVQGALPDPGPRALPGRVVDAGEEALMLRRAPVTRAILIVIAVVFLAEFIDPDAILERGG